VTVIVDKGEHPSHGKGRPGCKTCHGAGVVVIADSPRGRAAGLQFPGAFKCACVDPYQAKRRRRNERRGERNAVAEAAAQRQARELEHLALLELERAFEAPVPLGGQHTIPEDKP